MSQPGWSWVITSTRIYLWIDWVILGLFLLELFWSLLVLELVDSKFDSFEKFDSFVFGEVHIEQAEVLVFLRVEAPE